MPYRMKWESKITGTGGKSPVLKKTMEDREKVYRENMTEAEAIEMCDRFNQDYSNATHEIIKS